MTLCFSNNMKFLDEQRLNASERNGVKENTGKLAVQSVTEQWI